MNQALSQTCTGLCNTLMISDVSNCDEEIKPKVREVKGISVASKMSVLLRLCWQLIAYVIYILLSILSIIPDASSQCLMPNAICNTILKRKLCFWTIW
jgi:hypothetical protein